MRYLLFHKSIARFSFSSTNFSPRRLNNLLSWLSVEGDHDSTTLTFDDGYEHYRDLLPATIEQYNLRPIVFMPTGLIGKPASWDYSYRLCKLNHLERRSIRELAGMGVEFGSHGHTHSDLTALSQRRLEFELRESRAILSNLTGKKVDSISYPFGRCDARVMETAHEFGYDFGFGAIFPDKHDGRMNIGRIPIHGFDTRLSILAKLGSGWQNGIERQKVAVVNRMSGGTVILNRMRGSS